MPSDFNRRSDRVYDADESSNGSDAEQEQGSTVDSPDEETQLSQETTQEEYVQRPDMTNGELNASIMYRGGRFAATILFQWQITVFVLPLRDGRLCYVIVLRTIVFGIDELAMYNYGSRVRPYIPQPQSEALRCPEPMNFDRDAEEEGRVAQPTNETVELSQTITMVDTEMTPEATMTPPDAQGIEVPANPENTNAILLAGRNDPDPQPAAADDAPPPVTATDDPTCNVNPVVAAEARENVSLSSSGTADQIHSSASGFDQNTGTDLADQNTPAGQTSSLTNVPEPNVQNEVPPHQTELPNAPASTPATSSHDVMETNGSVNNPFEGADQLIVAITGQSPAPVPKPPSPVPLDDVVSQEQAY